MVYDIGNTSRSIVLNFGNVLYIKFLVKVNTSPASDNKSGILILNKQKNEILRRNIIQFHILDIFGKYTY